MTNSNSHPRVLALDIETTMTSPQEVRVITTREDNQDPEIIYEYAVDGPVVPYEVIEYINNSYVIVHNSFFDIGCLSQIGVAPLGVWDTMLAELAVTSSQVQVGYASLVKKYCDRELNKDLQTSDWSQALTDAQREYSLNDVMYLYKIAEIQKKYLIRTGSINHVLLKNKAISLIAGDLWRGVAYSPKILEEVKRECTLNYRKCLLTLLQTVPAKKFFNANITVKSIREAFTPFTAKASTMFKKPQLEEFFNDPSNNESIVNFILSNPMHDTLRDPISTYFARSVLGHFGIRLPSTSAQDLEDYAHNNPMGEATEVIKLILEMRSYAKIISNFVDFKGDKTQDGDLVRLRSRPTYTVTGRIGFHPFSVMPKGEDDEDIYGRIRKAFVPPKGYKQLAIDYKSVEDVFAGVLYNDAMKLKILKEGYDQYLMFASRLFGAFEYTSPDQTAELKKKYKTLRQAVKAASLGRNYGMGAKKLGDTVNAILEQSGSMGRVDGNEVMDSWKDLYQGVASAQQRINDKTLEILNETYESFDYDRETKRALMTRDPFGTGDYTNAKKREEILFESRLNVGVSSILGLRRDFFAHKCFQFSSYGSKSVRVTDLGNHIIQSSAGEVLWLAVIILKTLFPSITIAVTIHDSIVMYVPENGIGDMGLEEVKENVQKLMALAGWAILGYELDSDGDYIDCGW